MVGASSAPFLKEESPVKEIVDVSRVIDIITDVQDEVVEATAAHGPMTSRHEAFGVILEELDEFWDEVKLNPAKMSPEGRSNWEQRMRKELIQTAAMCVRAVLDLGL
jgi:hypothetical protein